MLFYEREAVLPEATNHVFFCDLHFCRGSDREILLMEIDDDHLPARFERLSELPEICLLVIDVVPGVGYEEPVHRPVRQQRIVRRHEQRDHVGGAQLAGAPVQM